MKKEEISTKLYNHITADVILREAKKEKMMVDKAERINILTKQDISNVATQYHINVPHKRHQNDAISVDLLVDELITRK